MGLDMYLYGKKFHATDWDNPANNVKEDGFEVGETTLRIGYWRKHPNLHGYIVQTFAEGKDECQEIDLSLEDLQKTLAAVEADALPHTEGFFFGTSYPEDKPESIKILKSAIEWLQGGKKGDHRWRSVVYRASW